MPHDIPRFFRVLGTRCCIHCIALLSLEHNLTSFQRLVDLTLPQPGFHITMGHSAAHGSNPPNMNKPWVHPRINQEESMSGCRDVGMSGCRDVCFLLNMNKPRVHPQTIRNGEFIGMMFFFSPAFLPSRWVFLFRKLLFDLFHSEQIDKSSGEAVVLFFANILHSSKQIQAQIMKGADIVTRMKQSDEPTC